MRATQSKFMKFSHCHHLTHEWERKRWFHLKWKQHKEETNIFPIHVDCNYFISFSFFSSAFLTTENCILCQLICFAHSLSLFRVKNLNKKTELTSQLGMYLLDLNLIQTEISIHISVLSVSSPHFLPLTNKSTQN